jgi:hypothetical protein
LRAYSESTRSEPENGDAHYLVGKYTVDATKVAQMNERFVNTGLSAPIAVAVSGITYSS